MTTTSRPIHFLIVDDLEENLLSLEALLRRDGLAFLRARSGEEALELLLQHDVALALLDVQMPGMDGFELAEFMRGSERARRIPIIFLTAGTADLNRRFRGYEAGAVDFIQKPIEPDILRSKANVFFDLHEQRLLIQEQRDALETTSRALAKAANDLEAQVEQRTGELENALTQLRVETAERERAEASLRQSQKMEAVGQLTGGIAHDFNNMLTGVIGSLDLMKRRIAAQDYDKLGRYMDAASTSASRAAALTQRLLAFSRRQSLDPKPTNINALIESMADLIDRAVNESISLTVRLAPDLPAAIVDPHQLENAILNLVINARDAMSQGGTLDIETELVAGSSVPGLEGEDAQSPFLKIGVADSGIGMPAEIIEKVFDPFFTTKPLGHGTGLGLSMVYGFIRQSGGHVAISSEPDRGTKMDLYLPTTQQQPLDLTDAPPAARSGRGQRVLVVEDDESVRMVVREVLRELHYEAIEYGDPVAATACLASAQRIDLMISDMGLPGMTGRDLFAQARTTRPDLPVLFITGYDADAAAGGAVAGEGVAMITKPFSLDALAATISQLLPT
ncbi:response regulator [Sphingomonas crocodyli]|uniref:histidine kinase n=1 Tax=Sphingomonas crocodyli TaxID=1979270 RepID=A0A437LYH0_9SPHN|nr:response regulator [Sphingomonas crocodyli]RVT90415.1 response regulator [Sphingomonas crocodyli]